MRDHLWPCHRVGQEEEAKHCVCERLDAASVNVLLLVTVQKVKSPAVHLRWRPVLACKACSPSVTYFHPALSGHASQQHRGRPGSLFKNNSVSLPRTMRVGPELAGMKYPAICLALQQEPFPLGMLNAH